MTTAKISQILTPHSSVTTQPMLMKFETYEYNYCRKTTPMPNSISIVRCGSSGRMPSFPLYHKVAFFVFFYLFVKYTGHTGGPILTICTSYDFFPCKDVALRVLLIYLPISGVKSPKTIILGVRICIFKPNTRNIQTFILSKLLHGLQRNFAHQ